MFWVSAGVNSLRLLFLVVTTLFIQFEVAMSEDSEDAWFAAYCYTLSNLPVLLSYLMGFSLKEAETGKQSTLL